MTSESPASTARPSLCAAPGSVPLTETRRSRVQGKLANGRYYETEGWMTEPEALDYAAGLRASGRYASIEVLTQVAWGAKWRLHSRTPYPPNDQAQTPPP